MRSMNFNEEEIKTFKKYINITKKYYSNAFFDGKITVKDYNRMDKIISKFYNLKKTRVRYDKTQTQRYKEVHDS